MKRLIVPALLALATLGVVHPNSALASTRTLGLPNLAASVGIGVHSNIVASLTGEIVAFDVYCTDGTTTCDSPPYTNFGAAHEGEVEADFYGTDPTASYPFSFSGNTPNFLAAICAQGYIGANGDRHVQELIAETGTNGAPGDPGTITGKAVLLPSDTPTNTAAYAGMNVAGSDTTTGVTINYVKGNQYTNNVTEQIIGGSGFQISLDRNGSRLGRDNRH